MKKQVKRKLFLIALAIVAIILLYKLFAPQCRMECTEDANGRLACMPVCESTPDQQRHGGPGEIDADDGLRRPNQPVPMN